MILLDTDHVSVLRMPSGVRRDRLVSCMALSPEPVSIPVVVVEESMRGWMTALAKERKAIRQVYAYRELASLFDFFAEFEIVPFDDAAATRFDGMGSIKIGSSDRKIAAIALEQNALLITANRRDFEQVPDLRFENWMDG